jgi:hypothetical protein
VYVAATVAVRCDPGLAACEHRLLGRGKSRRSARCAVMHKLLRRMMGRLRAFYAARDAAGDVVELALAA